jgi:uncharacterized protein
MKTLNYVAFILTVIGALNWGLVGLRPEMNLVALLFKAYPMLERGIYILIGLSAIWTVITQFSSSCKECVNK